MDEFPNRLFHISSEREYTTKVSLYRHSGKSLVCSANLSVDKNAFKRKLASYFDQLAFCFKNRMGEKVDWAEFRPGFEDEVPAPAHFNAVRGMVAEVIRGEA